MRLYVPIFDKRALFLAIESRMNRRGTAGSSDHLLAFAFCIRAMRRMGLGRMLSGYWTSRNRGSTSALVRDSALGGCGGGPQQIVAGDRHAAAVGINDVVTALLYPFRDRMNPHSMED
jgi:hypothetical protein